MLTMMQLLLVMFYLIPSELVQPIDGRLDQTIQVMNYASNTLQAQAYQIQT